MLKVSFSLFLNLRNYLASYLKITLFDSFFCTFSSFLDAFNKAKS